MKKKFMLLCASLFISFGLLTAQTRQVTGYVLSADDDLPVIGATVLIKGTQTGTATDRLGKFSLENLPATAKTLVVSFIGMQTIEVEIKPQLTIRMHTDTRQLDEVMVVAYGTTKKSSFTGAAQVIKNDQIEKMNVVSVTKALEGTSPGLQVMGGTGQPGSGASIRIRGIGSLNSSSAPLYVLNGAVFDGDISSINPDDIESISVLKDAASAALYGARGANGVIVIQTKKGNVNRSTLNVKAVWGFSSRAIPEYDRVGVQDYYELAWESYRNSLLGKNTLEKASALASANLIKKQLGGYNNYDVPDEQLIGTDGKLNPSAHLLYHDDWGDALFQTGLKQDYNLSMSGGAGKTSYYLSLGWLDEEGIMTASDYKRFSVRTNITSEFADWFNLEGNIGYTNSKTTNLMQAKGNYAVNPFYYTRNMGPIFPVWERDEKGNFKLDEKGERIYDYGRSRPFAGNTNNLASLKHDISGNHSDNFNLNLTAGTKFLRNFTFKVSGSADIQNRRSTSVNNDKYGDAANVKGRGEISSRRTESLTFNQILNYNRELGQHNVAAMLGHESYRYIYKRVFAQKTGFELGTSSDLALGTILENGSSQTDEYAVEGWLGQLNYNFADRYYLSASFRRDGSSRFYKDNRWGNFWSVGASWRITQEKFMQNIGWADNLKLKMSYGIQGNDNMPGIYYGWQNFFDSYPNYEMAGAYHSKLENLKLQWEKNSNLNIGIEFGLLDRLRGEINYFIRKGEDMLFDVPVPQSTGIASKTQNAASMDNKGIEFQISADIFKESAFKWTLDFNLTHYKNKITKLTQEEVWQGTKKWVKGGSIYDFCLIKWAGVDPKTGDELYWYQKSPGEWETTNSYSKASADPKDRQWCGSAIPNFYGGFTNNFSWQGLQLSVFFSYSVGGKMYDSSYQAIMHPGSLGTAWHKDILKRWQKEGDITDVPRLEKGNNNIARRSDRFIRDASYLCLRNVNLSYSLPQVWIRKIGLSTAKIFVGGDNLVTFSKYKGMNPVQAFSGTTDNTYVPNRIISVGLNVNF